MTLPNSTSKGGPYAGAGSTGPFVVPFYFLQNTDLLVTKTPITGADIILTYPADYAVSGVGNPLGGSITTTANIAVGEKLTITRNVPLTQGIALPATGPLPSASVETELDKLTMIAQQIQLQLDRSLKLSVSAANAAPSIADFTGNDQTVPVYNNTTKNFDVGPSLATITAAAGNAAAAAASAAAALISQNGAAASAASINYRYCGTATGSANALTLTPGAPLTSYTGALLEFIIASANTTEAMTVNASALGLKNLKINTRGSKTDPAIALFQPGMHVLGQYDGTDVVVVNAPWDSQATDIAAAATVALATATGNFANLTGTGGPITAMTGLPKGRRFLFRHTGIHTITNSGTLVCLGGANVITAAGDFSEWASDGTNVYMTRYERASGQPLVAPTVSGALTGITSINGGQFGGFRNKIINGAFNVWQRGTAGQTLTSTLAYGGPDRWAAVQFTSAAGTIGQNVNVPANVGASFCARIGRTAASSLTNSIIFVQAIETLNTIQLAGQTVTLSYYAKAGANFSAASSQINAILRTGTAVDEGANNGYQGAWTGAGAPINAGPTLTTSWQLFQHTVTLASNITELMVDFRYAPTGTAGADDNFYLWGVQLEIGSVATPFEHRIFGAEYEMCRRYYQKTFSYGTTPVQNAGTSTGEYRFVCNRAGASTDVGYYAFNPRMRTVNAVTLYNPNAANAQIRNISAGLDCTASTSGSTNDVGTALNGTGNAGNVIGDIMAVHFTVDAEL